MICPLHSLIVRKNIGLFIEKYDKWSTYTPEEESVLVAYSSVYGGTEKVVEVIAAKLADKGVKNIKMFDVSFTHHSKVLAEAFKASHIILATTTYNAGIFESMQAFIDSLLAHNLQNRKFVLIENGSWAPTAMSCMKTILADLKNITYIEPEIHIKSAMKQNQSEELDKLTEEIIKSI